ncbi:leukocyte cell-derived chemotaxin-2 isoform X2 [Labeo rohita]|uniref:leukocyte cell-derived chemotaxin-2 isoform X2 n=1 Tax=Labeo rohita TaxID=84645 RepID=UPI0021E27038|nr:leukocyte cell-derived chemotaxin-2 isoform X2 [Labeo rohita]
MLMKFSLIFLFLACLFLVGICLENDKKTTKRKEQGEEIKIPQPDKRLTVIGKAREALNWTRGAKPRNDMGCTSIGATAWSALCAGSHHNRARACDSYGCGGFNSRSDGRIHKGIDIVCGDYGIINAPFTGNLGGPVGRAAGDSVQYDGVKLYNKVHCVKIFNIRPYVYFGSVVQGEAMGYLLPLQEHFSGITSHLELQMCDGSDPSPFI